MSRIGATSGMPVPTEAREAAGTNAAKPAATAKDARVHKTALEFESMLVRQLLSAAKMGGHGKDDAYAGMAVDALASGIEKGGGLGLTRQIEESLARSASSPVKGGK